VDFELSLLPTTGFIEGTVQLVGGSGNVTDVLVSTGTVTVNPDENGYYILEAIPGYWEVSASLQGYYTQVIQDVLVVLEDTTSNVDFSLQSIPNVGYIEGYVTLYNGTGDVTQAEVTAGVQMVHPSADGHYFLGIEPGTYTVKGVHPYALPDSINNVTVAAGQTVSDVDLDLEIVRTNLVCRAVDTYNNILNDVDVEVTGPEGTYSGTIVDDSLVFLNVPYGDYNGSAWMEGEDPVFDSETLGQNNHEMVFVFDLTGLPDGMGKSVQTLKVRPNPSSDQSIIEFYMPNPGDVSVKVFSLQGTLVRNVAEGWMGAGNQSITWDGADVNGREVSPGLYMIMLQAPDMTLCIGTIRN
jgi:hypothetical protein